MLALGQESLQHGDADGAAEVTHHVEQSRCRTGVLGLDAGGGDCRQRREHQRLTDGADDVGPEQLIGGVVGGHINVHEVGGGEQHEADADDEAGIEPLHQPRHQRDQQQLRQTGPGQHHADLFGVVALDPRQVDRQDVDRAVQRDAEQEVGENAEAEIAPGQQPQVQQRLLRRQFDPKECASATAAINRQLDDEGRAEPVVLVAFLEHGLQRGEADRHGDDARPVALAEQRQLHRL